MRRFQLPLVLVISAGLLGQAALTKEDKEDGFEPLWKEKDLSAWKVYGGKKDVWGLDKGVLFTTGSGGGWLLSEQEYDNFELRLEYRFEKAGGNSGIGLRAPLTREVSSKGIEIQLIDDAGYEKVHNYKLKPTQQTGSIYGVVPPSKLPGKGPGEWNKLRIIARGRKITVELNGETVTDANLDDYKEHLKDHPGLARPRGHLGFQSHDGRVEFRRVRLKPL
jgi:hypothetical protein